MFKPDKRLDRQLASLAPLADPVRRALYLHVLARGCEVSRDEAASAAKVTRSLAAFHLDKLVESGLLEVSYRRLSGRQGPGAGRPSKLYRGVRTGIEVTIPPRRYELAAHLLAHATAEGGAGAAAALDRAAEEWGEEIGRVARGRAGDEARPARVVRSALEALREAGFQPRVEPSGEIVLGNCPFDALRREAPALICGMNLALCRGLVAGLGAEGWSLRLAPASDRCCVVIGTA